MGLDYRLAGSLPLLFVRPQPRTRLGQDAQSNSQERTNLMDYFVAPLPWVFLRRELKPDHAQSP